MATRVVENTYVLIAADAGSRRLLQVMDSRAMEIVRTPANRLIQTVDLAGSPLPKTYVKVCTEGSDGTVNIHKDCYTDLRGKSDYLPHTGKPAPSSSASQCSSCIRRQARKPSSSNPEFRLGGLPS